jgi:hypothetical protein
MTEQVYQRSWPSRSPAHLSIAFLALRRQKFKKFKTYRLYTMSIEKSRPSKPLKILTIDGGGLQAISTLLILDKLLDTIAKNNKITTNKPRPCDVFDTIAGIGAGGWIAILLGRFHMDITSCLSEWYKITSCITPKSKSEEMLLRVLQNSYYDEKNLMHQIGRLTTLYGTGKCLIPETAGNVRTQHVFVAALRTDGSQYSLFRSYEIPDWADRPTMMLEGPNDPKHYTIAEAFAVTGAAKYFSPSWKSQMEKSGKKRFSDTKFPKPHNITDLALNEMWCLYGKKVELSVVINIGPGRTDPYDVKHIARRFSFGLTTPPQSDHQAQSNPPSKRPPLLPMENSNLSKTVSNFMRRLSREDSAPKRRRVQFDPSATDENLHDENHDPSQPRKNSPKVLKRDTFGSLLNNKGQKISKELREKELDIQKHILDKLDKVYGAGAGKRLYFRLAPDQAPQGTALNDSEASGLCLSAATSYTSSRSGKETNDAAASRWSDEFVVSVVGNGAGGDVVMQNRDFVDERMDFAQERKHFDGLRARVSAAAG